MSKLTVTFLRGQKGFRHYLKLYISREDIKSDIVRKKLEAGFDDIKTHYFRIGIHVVRPENVEKKKIRVAFIKGRKWTQREIDAWVKKKMISGDENESATFVEEREYLRLQPDL